MKFLRREKSTHAQAAMVPAADFRDDYASRVQWLNQVRLFQEIRELPGAIDALANIMEYKHYKHGHFILKEGEEGSNAYFLMSGTVKVQKDMGGGEALPIAVLESKDHPFLGEAALLQKDLRSATIVCETDCACLILHRTAFDEFCKSHPEWALPVVLRIARVVLERFHKTSNDVVLLYNALVSEAKGWSG